MSPELRKALFECTTHPDNHPNKALQGLLFCDDYIIASDSTLLVRVKKEFDFDKYLEDESGGIINCEYPEIRYGIFIDGALLPENMATVDELTRAAELVPKSQNEPGKRIALDIKGKMVYPPILLKALRVFKANGESLIHILVGDDRIQLQGEDTSAVVMTLGVKDNPNARCKEAYTVAQILAMEDLL